MCQRIPTENIASDSRKWFISVTHKQHVQHWEAPRESSLQHWALENHTLFLLAGGEKTCAAISIEMFSLIGSWRMPAMRISSSI